MPATLPQFKYVWLMSTAAIRGNEVLIQQFSEEGGDSDPTVMKRIGTPTSERSIIPLTIPLSNRRTIPFLPSDLPDPTRSITEVCKVCGFVAEFSTVARNPAWRTVCSWR